jgi:hypothetical protein
MSLRMRLFRDKALLSYFICLFAAFSVVIGMGITTSSVGSLTDSGEKSKSIVTGSPLAIRSDEFLRATPSQLSVLQEGNSNSLFDFTQSQFFVASQAGDIETLKKILNFDYVVIFSFAQRLPIDSGFALMWWLYSLMTLIFVPLWLRELRVPTGLAIFGGTLTWLVPTNHWWSMWPLVPVGLSAFAGYLFLKFAKSVKSDSENHFLATLKTIFLGLFTISVASRIPFTYQPWGIPVALIFFGITTAEIFFSSKFNRRQKSASIAVILGGLALTALYFWQNKDLYSNLLSTVYPGQRRSGSGQINVPIWAGPIDWQFQFLTYSEFVVSNQSELAIGLLIVLPISLATFFVTRSAASDNQKASKSTLIGLLIASALLIWTLAPWPTRLLSNNPLTLLPPERVAQILGVLVMILFVLVISDRVRLLNNESQQIARIVRSNAQTLTLFVLIISIFGIQEIQDFIAAGEIQPKELWITSIVVAIILALPLISNRPALALIPLLAFSLFSIYQVNPIMNGVGEILHSDSASKVRSSIAIDEGRWAADDMFMDALLIANGASMLSGQQGSGPNYDSWDELDPSRKSINAWNRGSNYVVFAWTPGQIQPEISNPTPDVIQIKIDPCDKHMAKLDLSWIVSRGQLSSSCLTSMEKDLWMGREFFIYKVADAS